MPVFVELDALAEERPIEEARHPELDVVVRGLGGEVHGVERREAGLDAALLAREVGARVDGHPVALELEEVDARIERRVREAVPLEIRHGGQEGPPGALADMAQDRGGVGQLHVAVDQKRDPLRGRLLGARLVRRLDEVVSEPALHERDAAVTDEGGGVAAVELHVSPPTGGK